MGFGWSGAEDEGGLEWRAEVRAFLTVQQGKEEEERQRRAKEGNAAREGKGKEGDRARKRRTISGIQSELGTGRPGNAGWDDVVVDDDDDDGCFSRLCGGSIDQRQPLRRNTRSGWPPEAATVNCGSRTDLVHLFFQRPRSRDQAESGVLV